MTAKIRIDRITIGPLSAAPSQHAFGQRLQTAIAAALRPALADSHRGLSLPQLRLTLPHGATEADVAAAVAQALRNAIAGER